MADEKDRTWIKRIVGILADDLGVGVEHLEWLPDAADHEHLHMVVGGEERRVAFRKRHIRNFMHHELALEAVLVKVLRALGKKARGDVPVVLAVWVRANSTHVETKRKSRR